MVPSVQKLPLSSRRAGSLSARQLSTRSVRFKVPWPPERKTQADEKEKEAKEEDEDEHGVASARAAAEYIIEEGGWQRMDKKKRALPIKGFDRVAANAQDHIQSQGPMVPSVQKLPLSSRRAGSLSARQLSTRSVRFKVPWPPERKTQADCKEKEEKEEDEDEH